MATKNWFVGLVELESPGVVVFAFVPGSKRHHRVLAAERRRIERALGRFGYHLPMYLQDELRGSGEFSPSFQWEGDEAVVLTWRNRQVRYTVRYVNLI